MARESTGKCLIVLTALRFSPRFGTAALESAAERGEDVILCLVVDREMSDSVAGQLADVGFLGEKVMHDLRATMVEEYRSRGLGHLEELKDQARGLGLKVQTEVGEGPFVEVVRQLADRHDVDRVVASRLERTHLSRLFFGSEVDRLVREMDRPVDVFDATRTRPGLIRA